MAKRNEKLILDKMVFLRSCCICVSLRTGTLIIAILGIILGAILIAPMSVFLEYHSFYIATFVTSGRDTAKLDDAEVIDQCLYIRDYI